MRFREIGGMTCSVGRSLAVVGEPWTLLILRDAFLGVRRFDAFQAHLGATPHLLADRLRKLVAAGVLERVAYQERPRRYEYRLTEKGRDLYPVIASLLRWGDRWLAGEAGPPLELRHRRCGHVTTPVLSCSECGEPLHAREVQPEPGPALRGLEEPALRAVSESPPHSRPEE